MKPYTILTGATNPILRCVADPIDIIDDETIRLARDMKLVCNEYDGVGLAAPQIGLAIRIIYTTQWKKTPKGLKYVADQIMINPEIVTTSTTMNTDIEGCLSLPGFEGKVKRFDGVRVRFLDTERNEVVKSYKGFDARVIQHEMDHLDGILYIDKAKEVWKVKDGK